MMDAADLELFVRTVRAATERHAGSELDAELANLGWKDALADDPYAAVSTLFTLQGESCTTSSALEFLVVDALGMTADGAVLPALGQWQAPAARSGDRLIVDGLALAQHDRVLVAHPDVAAVVDAQALDAQPVRGIDPTLGLRHVRGEVDVADAEPIDWSAAVASGQRALAHELVGASRTMLELARVHALERVQFDKPIAAFQAVRHRLAETLVAIETADAMLAAAWEDGSTASAAMAKGIAGRSARTTARHCQQVLAGIGFTTEHPLHTYVRRVLVLDQLFGSSKLLTKELGAGVLTTRQLPALSPL
jgi:hypothetical protein